RRATRISARFLGRAAMQGDARLGPFFGLRTALFVRLRVATTAQRDEPEQERKRRHHGAIATDRAWRRPATARLRLLVVAGRGARVVCRLRALVIVVIIVLVIVIALVLLGLLLLVSFLVIIIIVIVVFRALVVGRGRLGDAAIASAAVGGRR